MARVTLPTDQSFLERDRLLAELDRLQSADDAANWAHRRSAMNGPRHLRREPKFKLKYQ
jgi:hypothetical protein